MFAVSIFFILNSSYWDTPINLSLMLSCTCKVGILQVFMEWHFKCQISIWQSLDLVFCTLSTRTCAPHGDAASFGSCSNLPTTLGSRSPDFQNASGMFQTQMCDSQLPHLGLGIHGTNKGKDSRAKGESKTLIFTNQVMFQHLYESHV